MEIEKVYIIQFSIDWLKMHFHARDNLNRFYFLETYFHHKDNFCTIITRKQVSKSLRSFVFISFIFNTVVCIYLCVCISSIQHDILLVTLSIELTECKIHLFRLLLAHNWKLTCISLSMKTKVIIIQFVVININYLQNGSDCKIICCLLPFINFSTNRTKHDTSFPLKRISINFSGG